MLAVLAAMWYDKKMLMFFCTYSQIADLALAISVS